MFNVGFCGRFRDSIRLAVSYVFNLVNLFAPVGLILFSFSYGLDSVMLFEDRFR